MARPLKTSLDWFRHDAHAVDSMKFAALRASGWGWAGEGRYWALVCLIAQSTGGQIDLSRKFVLPSLATRLQLTEAELTSFLADLRDDFELVSFDGAILSTDRIRQSYDEVSESRRDSRRRFEERRVKNLVSQAQNPSTSAQNKGSSQPDTDTDTDIQNQRREEKKEKSSAIAVSKKKLSPLEKALHQSTLDCFEASAKAKAMIYQDKATVAREMKAIKVIVERAQSIAPGLEKEFIEKMADQFRFQVNSKLKGKASWVPSQLAQLWIWNLVLDLVAPGPKGESAAVREAMRVESERTVHAEAN